MNLKYEPLLIFKIFCFIGSIISIITISTMDTPMGTLKILFKSIADKTCINKDVVLIHGLANQHPFGHFFLYQLENDLCPNNKFIQINLDNSTEISNTIDLIGKSRNITIGNNSSWESGTQILDTQVSLLDKKIKKLKEQGYLKPKFNIIAHSLGGIISLEYLKQQPQDIEKIISIGTPYKDISIIKPYGFVSKILKADKLIDELDNLSRNKIKIEDSLDNDIIKQKVYTLAGQTLYAPYGRYGELIPGWLYVSFMSGKTNDGLLIPNDAKLPHANHIGNLPNTDHFNLTQDPIVAKIITYILRN